MASLDTVRDLQSKLSEHQSQLRQVEQLLVLNANDEVLLKLRDDLVQVRKQIL